MSSSEHTETHTVKKKKTHYRVNFWLIHKLNNLLNKHFTKEGKGRFIVQAIKEKIEREKLD